MSENSTWTVGVYMVADTGDSFYHDAMADITEMMKAQFDNRVRLIVHADAPGPWETKCFSVTGKPAGGKIGVATGKACNHKSLLDFVQDVVKNYKSDNYLLVLWGHGEGIDWKQKVLAGEPPSSTIAGAGKRFAPGSQGALEVGELGKALAALDLKGLRPDNVVVGFDACLMGMVEVFDEIKEYVGWVVAADDEIPDTGWPYTDLMNLIGQQPDKMTAKEAADGAVTACAKWYSRHEPPFGDVPDTWVSFASCNLSKSGTILTAMTVLTEALIAGVADRTVHDAVSAARNFAEDLQEKAYVDINAFCKELKRQATGRDQLAQVNTAAEGVIAALGEFISNYKFSDAYPYRYSEDARGVSICFPESAELMGSISDLRINWGSYIDLTFNRLTHWPAFLEAFWGKTPSGAQDAPKALAATGGGR